MAFRKLVLAAAGTSALLIAGAVQAAFYTVDYTAGDISVEGFIETNGFFGNADGVGEFIDFELNVTGTGFDFTFVDPDYALFGAAGTPWIISGDAIVFDTSNAYDGFIGGFTDGVGTAALFFCVDAFCDFGDPGNDTGTLVNISGATLAFDPVAQGTLLTFATRVPEPTTLALIGLGLLGLARVRRSR